MSMCQSFCRLLLKGVFEEVKKNVPVDVRKSAWTYKSCGCYEFQIPKQKGCPDGFYTTTGRGCCKWYARFQGWCEYLDHIGVEYDDELEEKVVNNG